MTDIRHGGKEYTEHVRFRYHRGNPVALRLIRCYHDMGGNPEKMERALRDFERHAHISHSRFSGVVKGEGEGTNGRKKSTVTPMHGRNRSVTPTGRARSTNATTTPTRSQSGQHSPRKGSKVGGIPTTIRARSVQYNTPKTNNEGVHFKDDDGGSLTGNTASLQHTSIITHKSTRHKSTLTPKGGQSKR
jgi:hypothetical protein